MTGAHKLEESHRLFVEGIVEGDLESEKRSRKSLRIHRNIQKYLKSPQK